jgi:23S rRNA G2445 N2-methylase RlmL
MAHQMWSAVDGYIADRLIPEDPALDADGRLITLEADARCAALARENIANAGLAQIVHVRVGDALRTLPELVDEGRGRST